MGRIVLSEHVAKVAEFMEREIPADRLEYVASRLPAIARVLWSEGKCGSLTREPIRATQSNANESGLAARYVGDGSGVAVGARTLK